MPLSAKKPRDYLEPQTRAKSLPEDEPEHSPKIEKTPAAACQTTINHPYKSQSNVEY